MGKVCPDCETARTMALEGGRAAARREREKPAVEMAPLAFPITPMTLLEDTGTTRREGKPGGGKVGGGGEGGWTRQSVRAAQFLAKYSVARAVG